MNVLDAVEPYGFETSVQLAFLTAEGAWQQTLCSETRCVPRVGEKVFDQIGKNSAYVAIDIGHIFFDDIGAGKTAHLVVVLCLPAGARQPLPRTLAETWHVLLKMANPTAAIHSENPLAGPHRLKTSDRPSLQDLKDARS